MNTVVLIGGTNDGKRVSVFPNQTHVVMEVLPYKPHPIEKELYTLIHFTADSEVVRLYKHDSLTDMEVFLLLLKNYNPERIES